MNSNLRILLTYPLRHHQGGYAYPSLGTTALYEWVSSFCKNTPEPHPPNQHWPYMLDWYKITLDINTP